MVGQRGGLVQLPRPVDGRSYRDVSGADVRGQPQESRTTNANLAGTLSQIAAGETGKRGRVRRGNWRAYAGLAAELLESAARLRGAGVQQGRLGDSHAARTAAAAQRARSRCALHLAAANAGHEICVSRAVYRRFAKRGGSSDDAGNGPGRRAVHGMVLRRMGAWHGSPALSGGVFE